MIRSAFNADTSVVQFVGWLARRLDTLEVKLAIGNSRFVPGGLRVSCKGVEAVTDAYLWRAPGTGDGDWASTTVHCARLAANVQSAVLSGSRDRTLEASWRIIEWGGGSQAKGAYPFLAGLIDPARYLLEAREAFALDTADTSALCGPVTAMNAMLTKVHAFVASDGLPIYDSRVAVAIATLVEVWRRNNEQSSLDDAIPVSLHFPTLNGRALDRCRVTRCFPDARCPAHLGTYGNSTTCAWAGAKVRLGWLLQALLEAKPDLYAAFGTLAQRTRALEAALFMIGYDVRCLRV